MKWFMACLSLFFIAGPTYTEQVLLYKVHDDKTHEVVNENSFQIGVPTDNQIVVHWNSMTGDGVLEHIVDVDYATKRWHLQVPKEDTDYTGERNGRKLILRGRHKGKKLDKTVEIDDLPLFFQPVLGLAEFVRSGEKSIEFRSLRPDTLKHYKMKAKRQDMEMVEVNGEDVPAVRVKWGVTGLLSKIFSQTYWFRESDGVYLRSKPAFGAYTVFAGEADGVIPEE